MMNIHDNKAAVKVFVFSQILNTFGTAIALSCISKLVSVWFPFSERIWALMACMVMFLLGCLFVFLGNLLFDPPTIRPGDKAEAIKAVKELIAIDI